MSKKKSRRSLKYPALSPEFNLKTRYEEIEDLASYADSLPESAKEWLNAYAEEEICANFNHRGPKLNTEVDEKRRCYRRNNARNRCIMTREKAQGTMNYIETQHDEDDYDD